jgi:hypothetical protein
MLFANWIASFDSLFLFYRYALREIEKTGAPVPLIQTVKPISDCF